MTRGRLSAAAAAAAWPVAWITIALSALCIPACRRTDPDDRTAPIVVNGTGATLPGPLYDRWTAEYRAVEPRFRLNYQAIGSGAGLRWAEDRTTDFATSDVALRDDPKARGAAKLVHVPVTVGAVAIAYNTPGNPPETEPIRLSPRALSGIFLGEIRVWNDPAIAALNPDVALAATPITVVYRADGSGSTATLTDLLARTSVDFRARVGVGTSVSFPTGLGARGSDGVTAQIAATPGSIGYVELAYARHAHLAVAAVQNGAGRFVLPSVESITAATVAMPDVPDDLRMTLVDAPGESAYSLATYSYALVHEDAPDAVKGEALARFLWWALHDGQRFAAALTYAPLPPAVVARAEARLRALRVDGRRILAVAPAPPVPVAN